MRPNIHTHKLDDVHVQALNIPWVIAWPSRAKNLSVLKWKYLI